MIQRKQNLDAKTTTVAPNWHRAFAVLERSKLAETSLRADTVSGNQSQKVILSPEIIRGFSSGSITEEICEFFI